MAEMMVMMMTMIGLTSLSSLLLICAAVMATMVLRFVAGVSLILEAQATGEISKLAMLHAVETSPLVARRLFPGWQLVVWGTWLAMRVLTLNSLFSSTLC